MTEDALPDELLDRVESLTAQLDELSDAHAREVAQDLVGAVIAMYGDGLRRIVETIMAAREAGATIMDELTQDGAVASLLLIHDLYPSSLEERVTEALETVRPYMESHGGNVELIAIDEGVARLQLQGSCHGCAASRATLELAIKQALDEHCPDLEGLEVEGVIEEPFGARSNCPSCSRACRWPTRNRRAGCRSRRQPRHPASCGRSRSTARSCCWRTSTDRCSPTATSAPRAASDSTRASSGQGFSAARPAGSSSTCRGPVASWAESPCS